MTIPILPIPDTRPGYASQVPGDVGALSGGIQAVLQALLQGQQMQQGQQQIDLQAQQIQQQGDRIKAEAAKAALEARNAEDIGRAIQALGSPTQRPVRLPNGLTAQLPVGESPTPEEVAGGLRPELVPEFYEQAKPAIEAREERAAEARRRAVFKATSDAMPEWMRRPFKIASDAKSAGLLPDGAVSEMFTTALANGMTPEQVADIDRELPEFASLPLPAKVKAFIGIRELTAERRLGIGAEGARQAQQAIANARLAIARERLKIAKATTPGSKLSATLAYLRVIDTETSDLSVLGLTHPELIGKPRRTVVEGLFGKEAAKAYDDAVIFLQTQVPATTPPTPSPR